MFKFKESKTKFNESSPDILEQASLTINDIFRLKSDFKNIKKIVTDEDLVEDKDFISQLKNLLNNVMFSGEKGKVPKRFNYYLYVNIDGDPFVFFYNDKDVFSYVDPY